MAMNNFIPEIWTAAALGALREELVFAQPGIINREYEGEIKQFGDTVHITSVNDPQVRDYAGTITWDDLTDLERALLIDQKKYFAFTVDDIDKAQAKADFVDEATKGASHNLALAADTFVATTMAAGVDASNQVGATTIATPDEAYKLLVKMRRILKRSYVPADQRWITVPPEMYSLLLEDKRFTDASKSGTTDTLRNGQVGRAAGFDVIEANTVPETGGVFTVIGGHPMATTYADQILKTESVKLENRFGDGIRGLHVYGAKVIRPKALVTAEVTV